MFFCNRGCKSLWHSKQFEEDRKNNKGKTSFECPICHDIVMVNDSELIKKKTCSYGCDSINRSLNGNTDVNCDYCGNTFEKLNSKITKHNFCNKACSGKWNSEKKLNRISKECIICDKKFTVVLSRKDTAKTCSKECHYKHISNISNGDGIMVEHLKRNGVKSMISQKKSGTKPEIMTEKCLTNLGINFEPQYPMYDKFVVDFYLPDYNTILEVYGDYWHNNPEVYGKGLSNPSERQISQSKKDKSKEGYLKKCGHDFVYIWEKDIYKDVEKEIKGKILQNK